MVDSYPPDYIPLGEAFEKAVLALEKVRRSVELAKTNFGKDRDRKWTRRPHPSMNTTQDAALSY